MIFQYKFPETTTQKHLSIASKMSSEDPVVKILEKIIKTEHNEKKLHFFLEVVQRQDSQLFKIEEKFYRTILKKGTTHG